MECFENCSNEIRTNEIGKKMAKNGRKTTICQSQILVNSL